ncbi:hypothetical protein [Marinoscillum sp.]|uniref:hypothetical protein n=1 Tax=Marinoscillum sp. TaxID=2024838 RepID=UPI003BAB198B
MVSKGVFTFLMVCAFFAVSAQNLNFSVEILGGAGMGWSEIEETFINGAEDQTYVLTEGTGVGTKSMGVLVGRGLGQSVFTLLAGVEVQQTGGRYIFSSGHFYWNTDKAEWDIESGEIRKLDQRLLRLQFPVVLRADVGSGFQLSFSAFPSFNIKHRDHAWSGTEELLPDLRFKEDFSANGRFSLGLIKSLNPKLALSVSWVGDFQKREFVAFNNDIATVSPAYHSVQLNLHLNCSAFW